MDSISFDATSIGPKKDSLAEDLLYTYEISLEASCFAFAGDGSWGEFHSPYAFDRIRQKAVLGYSRTTVRIVFMHCVKYSCGGKYKSWLQTYVELCLTLAYSMFRIAQLVI